MEKIKKLFRIIIAFFCISFITLSLGLIGSTNSTASGVITNVLNNDMLNLSERSDMYGNFMTTLFPVITGKNIDFNKLPLDSIQLYLNEFLNLYPNISPIKNANSNNVSSGFGWRISPITKRSQFHDGIDINMPLHTKINSTMSGVIEEVKYTSKASYGYGYGNFVVIKNNLGFETLYAHLSQIYVKKGQHVIKGQLIGTLGVTGNATGPNLHYEVHQSGDLKNPLTSLFMLHKNELIVQK
jgi:murein DD-endopeptidase MepM/ murein hydrolase activator NlpD